MLLLLLLLLPSTRQEVDVTGSTPTTEVQEDVFTTEDEVQDTIGGVLLYPPRCQATTSLTYKEVRSLLLEAVT